MQEVFGVDQEQIFLAFARKQVRKGIALGVALGLLFLGYLAAGYLTEGLVMALALAIFGGIMLFLWIDWRCPACDHTLGREFSYKHCPHCGQRLTA